MTTTTTMTSTDEVTKIITTIHTTTKITRTKSRSTTNTTNTTIISVVKLEDLTPINAFDENKIESQQDLSGDSESNPVMISDSPEGSLQMAEQQLRTLRKKMKELLHRQKEKNKSEDAKKQ